MRFLLSRRYDAGGEGEVAEVAAYGDGLLMFRSAAEGGRRWQSRAERAVQEDDRRWKWFEEFRVV
jgi:hypothetical protein